MRFKAWYDKFTDTITITEDDGMGSLFFLVLLGALFCAFILVVFFIPQILFIRYSKKKTNPADRAQFLARGNVIISACYCIIILYLFFDVPGSYSYMFMLALAAISGSIYSLIFSIHAKYKFQKNPFMLKTYGTQCVPQCIHALKISAITLGILLILSALLVLLDPTFLIYF